MKAPSRFGTWAAILAMSAMVVTGCDEEDSEHSIRAGDASYSGEEVEVDDPSSAGPLQDVQGRERPEGHPTMDGQGDVEMAAPSVDRPGVEDVGQSGPIQWEAPDHWHARTPSNEMRYAEYAIESDGGEAELTVFFFGPGGGGGVEQNLERWSAQFSGEDEARRSEMEVEGMTVHTLDVSGTYESDMAMGAASGPQEDQRLLGAIAEAEAGLFFFRLLGDASVVGEEEEGFGAFVESMRDES